MSSGSKLRLILERFLFLLARWFLFSSGSYSYPSRRRGSNLINAISLEEELGRAQSNPTHTKDIRSRLDTEQRPRSKVVLYFS